MTRFWKELLDFTAHAASAFLMLVIAGALGNWFIEWPGAIFLAWAPGFVREFTEWQDGGRHPFTRWGLLDQAGWIFGGVVYVLVVLK